MFRFGYSVSHNIGILINRMNNNNLDNRRVQSSNNTLNTNSGCNFKKRYIFKVKENRCLESNIVCEATVSTHKVQLRYIGSCSTNRKTRISSHMNTFRMLHV